MSAHVEAVHAEAGLVADCSAPHHGRVLLRAPIRWLRLFVSVCIFGRGLDIVVTGYPARDPDPENGKYRGQIPNWIFLTKEISIFWFFI